VSGIGVVAVGGEGCKTLLNFWLLELNIRKSHYHKLFVEKCKIWSWNLPKFWGKFGSTILYLFCPKFGVPVFSWSHATAYAL